MTAIKATQPLPFIDGIVWAKDPDGTIAKTAELGAVCSDRYLAPEWGRGVC